MSESEHEQAVQLTRRGWGVAASVGGLGAIRPIRSKEELAGALSLGVPVYEMSRPAHYWFNSWGANWPGSSPCEAAADALGRCRAVRYDVDRAGNVMICDDWAGKRWFSGDKLGEECKTNGPVDKQL